MNTITVTIYTISAIEIILGSIVLLNDRKNKINQLFFAVALVTSYWILTNAFTTLEPNDLWIKNSYAVGILLSPVILIWILHFISKKNTKSTEIFAILFSGITFSLITLFTDLIIKEVTTSYIGGFEGSFGILFPLYSLYFIVISLYILYLCVRAYKESTGQNKIQYKCILLGLFGFAFVTTLVSFILPLFGFDLLIPLDSASSIFFIVGMSYAILKHHLFSVKVIVTELLVFSLWISILLRTLLSEGVQDRIANGALLILVVIIGIFLIKSVFKEVKQREKIELLAADLQKANDRLRELDRQKSEFVSFATHQLRAPLTAMKGYASLILEGDLGKLSREIKSAITRIYDSSNTLANIVDDYLNISRIELGSMRYSFDNVDLKDLLDHVIGELRPNIEKSGLKFDIQVDRERRYMVHVDKDKFKQIIANLVDNAIKYTPTGTVVVSIVKKKVGNDPKILFSVKDNGIGIAPEVLPKLFAKFTRADNGSRQNIHGTGLGLFVAKEIVTAHKGRIWAESTGEGKGSIFSVELDEVI